MRGEWMECEFHSPTAVNIHLPAPDTSSILLPSLHPTSLYPCTSASSFSSYLMFLFSVPLPVSLKCQTRYFITPCDGGAVKGNGTSATEARTVKKRKENPVPSEGEGEKMVIARWKKKKMCALFIGDMCDKLDVCTAVVMYSLHHCYSGAFKRFLGSLHGAGMEHHLWFSTWKICCFMILVHWPFNHLIFSSLHMSCRHRASPADHRLSFLPFLTVFNDTLWHTI